jgi:hypothetical protein
MQLAIENILLSSHTNYVSYYIVNEEEELEQGIDRQTTAFRDMLKDSGTIRLLHATDGSVVTGLHSPAVFILYDIFLDHFLLNLGLSFAATFHPFVIDQKKTFDPAAYFRFKSEKEVETQDALEDSQQTRKLLEVRLNDIEAALMTLSIKDRLCLRDSDVKAVSQDQYALDTQVLIRQESFLFVIGDTLAHVFHILFS